ncbi:hypothetical protein [Asticcacaulis biprosthecium]|nr:hypothetical protein [Asticcacaulis biprosthecium]
MTYVELTNYSGFGHSADIHVRFDPLKFIDAETDNDRVFYVDMDLLRTGSAIVVLCAVFDTWLEGEHARATPAQKLALENGRFGRFPDIETTLKEALARGAMRWEDSWFDDAVQPIYRTYVLGYFRRLAESDRA